MTHAAARLRWRSAAELGAGSRAARAKSPRTARLHRGVAAGAVGSAAPEQLEPPTLHESPLAPEVSLQPAHARRAPLTPRTPVSGDSQSLTELRAQVKVRDDLRVYPHRAYSASAHAYSQHVRA